MELQTIYTQVLQHLARQGEPAMTTDPEADNYNECCYRDDKTGKRCAVGYLIPEHAYRESLEGQGAGDHDVQVVLRRVHGVGCDYASTLLAQLQTVHDGPLLDIHTGRADPVLGDPRVRLRGRLEHMERTFNLIRPKVFNEVFGL